MKTTVSTLIVLLAFFSCTAFEPNADQIKAFAQASHEYQLGHLAQSKAALDSLLKDAPDFYQALFLSGKVDYMNSNFPAAKDKFSKVLEKQPRHVDARFWLARTSIALAELAPAHKLAAELTNLASEDPRLPLLQASLDELDGDYPNALAHYKQAGFFSDELAKALINSARIYKRSLLTEDALRKLTVAQNYLTEDSYLKKPLEELKKELETKVKEPKK